MLNSFLPFSGVASFCESNFATRRRSSCWAPAPISYGSWQKKKKTSRKTHNAIYAAWKQLCEMVASIGAQEKEKSRVEQRTGNRDLKLGWAERHVSLSPCALRVRRCASLKENTACCCALDTVLPKIHRHWRGCKARRGKHRKSWGWQIFLSPLNCFLLLVTVPSCQQGAILQWLHLRQLAWTAPERPLCPWDGRCQRLVDWAPMPGVYLEHHAALPDAQVLRN